MSEVTTQKENSSADKFVKALPDGLCFVFFLISLLVFSTQTVFAYNSNDNHC